jgi:hypothetical protein
MYCASSQQSVCCAPPLLLPLPYTPPPRCCQGFPTIKFLYVSNGKIKSSNYQGGRSAKELVAFALDKVGRESGVL